MNAINKAPILKYSVSLILVTSVALLSVFAIIYINYQRDVRYQELVLNYHLATLKHLGTIKEGVNTLQLLQATTGGHRDAEPQHGLDLLNDFNMTNEFVLIADAAAAIQELQERYSLSEFALPNARMQKSLGSIILSEGSFRVFTDESIGKLLMVQLQQFERLHQLAYEELVANEVARKRDGRTTAITIILLILLFSSAGFLYLLRRLQAALRSQSQAEDKLRTMNADLDRRVRERTTDLENARLEAERASRAKSEFLSHMSHELRTPMNAVLGAAELLDYNRDQLNSKQRTYVHMIKTGGSHLLDLINEILDLARIESGKYELQLEQVEIGPVVQECTNLLAPVVEGRQLQLLDQIPVNAGCPVIADPKCLRQVILNLMSNAVKYNRDGGQVILQCEEDAQGRLKIGVTDTGPGIAAEDQSRIFQPFDRLHKDTHQEGTGIGLAVSRQLVELMGGELTVDSRPGEGSTFWVALERAASEPLTASNWH